MFSPDSTPAVVSVIVKDCPSSTGDTDELSVYVRLSTVTDTFSPPGSSAKVNVTVSSPSLNASYEKVKVRDPLCPEYPPVAVRIACV